MRLFLFIALFPFIASASCLDELRSAGWNVKPVVRLQNTLASGLKIFQRKRLSMLVVIIVGSKEKVLCKASTATVMLLTLPR
jgi:hypothetical protein